MNTDLTRRGLLASFPALMAGTTLMTTDRALAESAPSRAGMMAAPTVGPLPALAPGEQCYSMSGLSLQPSGNDFYSGLARIGNGAFTNGDTLSVPMMLPANSVLTGVDVGFITAGTNPTVALYVERREFGNETLLQGSGGPLVLSGPGSYTVTVDAGFGVSASETCAAFIGGAARSLFTGLTKVVTARVRYRPSTYGFTPIPPTRVYDSRKPMTPDANGVLSGGQNRTISVADGRDPATGAVTVNNVIPSSAIAVAATLVAANTTAPGFLVLNPGGTVTVGGATINWTAAGQAIANTTTALLGDNRTLTVVVGGSGSTNFVIDLVGYFTA